MGAANHTQKGFEMAEFTTRVELHGARNGDYEKLHDEMEILRQRS
jgi:hypothetical protein